MATGNLERVFVYGSLMSGLPNHRVLGAARMLGRPGQPRRIGPAFLAGADYRMFDLCGFPGLVLGAEEDQRTVRGELYEVDPAGLARLDRLEGHPRFYRREPREVVLSGATGPAWVYLLANPDHFRDRPSVPSNDWRTYLRDRERERDMARRLDLIDRVASIGPIRFRDDPADQPGDPR